MAANFRTLSFEDLAIGQRETLMRTIMSWDLTRFAEISGDSNPVHLSEHFAAKTRFGQRIAHGMFTGSLISALIGTRLPGAGSIYLSQSFEFLGPVKIGDVVEASVEVAELVAERRRARLTCECWVDAVKVLGGEAWVALPAARVPPPGAA